MSLKRIGLTGSLNNQPRVSARNFSSNRISLRRFPFATTPSAVATAVYVEDVFSTYLYTGNGTTQTISNGMDISGSIYGGYVEFDGVDDALITTMPALSGDFTVEFFFFPTDFDRAYILLDKSFRDTNFSIVTDYLNTGLFYVQVGAYGQINFSFNPPIVNQWSHVALCRSGSTVRMFLNGTLLSGGATGVTGAITTGTLYIGAGNSSGSGYEFTQGYISNLRITNTAIYTSNFTRPSSPLEAVSGTQLLTCKAPSLTTDLSPNAYSITISGAPISQTEGGVFNDTSKGGLVWIKGRSQAVGHRFVDTARGVTKSLDSSSGTFEASELSGVTAFSNTGFSLSNDVDYNNNASLYASWTFRRQAKFFDVVTYTGNGVASRQISHNLGSVPGCIFIKCTSVGYNWYVYHRSTGNNQALILNSTVAAASSSAWNNTTPTDTVFTVDGLTPEVNENGATYVAYLFAHDAGGFGLTNSDNVITCGTYLGDNHRSKQIVSLGYEPQWVMIKNITTTAQRWVMVDNIRGMCDNAPDAWLVPNSTAIETTVDADNIVAASTGFYFSGTQSDVNEAGATFIYMAIRRGPMKTPTTSTDVFQPIVYTGTNVDNRKVTTNILTDMIMARQRNSSTIDGFILGDRLRGNQYWETGKDSIAVIDSDSLMTPTVGYGNSFSAMDGFGVGNDPTSELNESVVSNNQIVEAFKRAPGFLDIVTYTGTGVARTVNHNLGVKPEMMWIKRLDVAVGTPYMYTSAAMAIAAQNMVAGSGFDVLPVIFNNTEPTSTQFTVGTGSPVNASGSSYVAYLMANVPGVSKCSYYVGRGVGTSHQVDCGFSSGVRFLLIKPLEQTGDFHVWDTARGIVAGNDPYLVMNDTIAEVTATDWVDPYSPGFEVTATATSEMNQGYAENWESQGAVAGTSIMEDILYAGGLWVVGSGNGNVYYGASGYSWTAAVAVSGGVNGLGFGNNLYVAVGPSGRISTSPDAVTWTTRTSGVATTLYGVAYGFGKYWVVGSSGTLLSSTDGTTWSSVSSGTGVTIRRIRFLNNNLVIVGDNGTLITSADGTTFTTQTSGTAQDLNDVTFGNGTYAACGDNGTIITSTNLSTWTTRSSGGLSTNLINGIVYAGYRFVAVANGGETGYSNDGTTWSTGSGASVNSLQCVAYGNDIVIAGNNDGDLFPSDVRYWYWAIA